MNVVTEKLVFVFRSFRFKINYTSLEKSDRSLDKEGYLDSLEWKNFTADRNFMRDHCGNELNIGRWTPASSSATKICLLPLAEDRVRRIKKKTFRMGHG